MKSNKPTTECVESVIASSFWKSEGLCLILRIMWTWIIALARIMNHSRYCSLNTYQKWQGSLAGQSDFILSNFENT